MLNQPEGPGKVITPHFFRGSFRRQKELHDYIKSLKDEDAMNRKILGLASDPHRYLLTRAVRGDR